MDEVCYRSCSTCLFQRSTSVVKKRAGTAREKSNVNSKTSSSQNVELFKKNHINHLKESYVGHDHFAIFYFIFIFSHKSPYSFDFMYNISEGH